MFYILGPQPPPRHGVSAINEAVMELAKLRGLAPTTLNTAPKSLDRSLWVRLGRWRSVWAAGKTLASFRRRRGVLYASMSGGWGLLWELLLVGLARSRGLRIVLHHHSFRYVDMVFRPMQLLVRVAGPSALHVVLCPGMKRGLQRNYPKILRTLVLSNAAFMGGDQVVLVRKDSEELSVGHLANLSVAKGLWDVVELAELAQKAGARWKFLIAGPFESDREEAEFRERTQSLKNIQYLGPLYGPAKDEFFSRLDVFLFPTHYRNEAEPLVLHEALGHGCPAIAFDRGCIAGIIDDQCGLLVRQNEPFVVRAIEALSAWEKDKRLYAELRRGALLKFQTVRAQSGAAREELFAELAGLTRSAIAVPS